VRGAVESFEEEKKANVKESDQLKETRVGKVVHKHLQETLYHIRKDADHAPLKSSGCIA